MSEPIFKPVVQHKGSKEIYLYEGENTYTNIRTQVKGIVPEELANKAFVFCPEISEMINEYPNVLELVKRLGLRLL